MTVLCDDQIIHRCRVDGMITPYETGQVKMRDGRPCISYGVGSYGYDFRLADDDLMIADGRLPLHLDPKAVQPFLFNRAEVRDEGNGRFIVIPPNSFALGRTVEHFTIPRDIITVAIGKSTYARIGVIPHITPFEPEWRGYATLEISNTAPLPARVYVNEGIAQLIFLKADDTCTVSYADRAGKYQNQAAQIVMARV